MSGNPNHWRDDMSLLRAVNTAPTPANAAAAANSAAANSAAATPVAASSAGAAVSGAPVPSPRPVAATFSSSSSLVPAASGRTPLPSGRLRRANPSSPNYVRELESELAAMRERLAAAEAEIKRLKTELDEANGAWSDAEVGLADAERELQAREDAENDALVEQDFEFDE